MPTLKTPSVPTVEKTLVILELLASVGPGLTLADLARRIGMAKSTAHSLLLTLERGGYVHRKERSERYVLGLKLYSLANLALGGFKIREQAGPLLGATNLPHRAHGHF